MIQYSSLSSSCVPRTHNEWKPCPPQKKHPQYPKQQVGLRWHDRVERGEPPGLYCKLKQNAKCLPQKVVMKQQKKKESRKGGKFRKIEKESKKNWTKIWRWENRLQNLCLSASFTVSHSTPILQLWAAPSWRAGRVLTPASFWKQA